MQNLISVLVVSLIFAASQTANAGPITFVKVLDENDTIPGFGAVSNLGGGAAVLDSGNVAFNLTAGTTQLAVLSKDGAPPTVVVHPGTPVPEFPSADFIGTPSPLSLDGDVLVFGSALTTLDAGGVFRVSILSPNPVTVVNGFFEMLSVPFGEFASADHISAADGTTAFQGVSRLPLSFRGIYIRDANSPTATITNQNMEPSPRAGTFTSFGGISLDSGVVAFSGVAGGVTGIYTTRSGTLEVVADTSMAEFDSLGGSTGLAGGRIVFVASGLVAGTALDTIVLDDGGVRSTLVDSSTVVPGGNGGTFIGFDTTISFDGDRLLFVGFGGGVSGGIFLLDLTNSALNLLIAPGDSILGGTTAGSFGLSTGEALSGDQIVFTATVAGVKGIYLATIPTIDPPGEPVPALSNWSLALLVICLAVGYGVRQHSPRPRTLG